MNKYYLVTEGVDGKFFLWNGPRDTGGNLNYAKFYGFNEDGLEIWIYNRSEVPQNAVEIGESTAKSLIRENKRKYYILKPKEDVE